MLDDVKPLVTALITAAITIVGVATPLVAAWLKQYFAVRENAAMNQTVTAAAGREAAMLLSCVPDVRQVTIGNPDLSRLAGDLMRLYPEYTDRLGLDLERTERLILGEAHKIYNTNLVPDTSTTVVATDGNAGVAIRRVPKE